MASFVNKLEKHPTIKLSPSVIAELRAITPSSYVGFFTPGLEVEVRPPSSTRPRLIFPSLPFATLPPPFPSKALSRSP